MIVFCAADLIWATRIKSTADSLGIPCRPVRNLEMLEARLADSPVRSLIVDLDAGPVAIDLVRRVRELECTRGGTGSLLPVVSPEAVPRPSAPIHILAFGPHVATDLFQQAKAAGANTLLARGAFNSRLPNILQSLAANPTALRDDLHD